MEQNKPPKFIRQWLSLALIPVGLAAGGCPSKSEPPVVLPPVSNELLAALSKDPAAVAEGKQLYLTTCVPCHGPAGQGVVGPNLTDDAWLHGGAPLDLHASISKGFPAKGMSPFESLLGPARVRSLTAYVLTIKGTHVAGKAPEGKPE